ncbi:hypothetical protein [Paenibacillus spongiae]|nr:hypothetical protein [Paenibacillus spongiae]
MEKYIEKYGMDGAGDVLREAAPEIWEDIYWRDNNDPRTRMDIF